MNDKSNKTGVEWLLMEGLVDAEGVFSLLSSRSQRLVSAHLPKGAAQSADDRLLLLDDNGEILARERVYLRTPVVCHEYEPGQQLLSGRLPFKPGAAAVVLLRQEREIYRCEIGRQPAIDVQWPQRQLQRGKRYSLALTLSKPDVQGDALLIMAIHWGAGHHRILALSEPVEKLTFDTKALPGGEACRLSVTYRVGFRSETVFSPDFSLPPLPPRLELLKPQEGAVIVAGAPLSLVAEVDDPQGDRSLPSALCWTLDGHLVGRSAQAVLAGLSEGEHTLQLTIEGWTKPLIKRKLKVFAAPDMD